MGARSAGSTERNISAAFPSPFGRGHDWGLGTGRGGGQINSVPQQVKLSAGFSQHPSELLHHGERQAKTELSEQITIMADQLMALIH